jgi:FolB domain-containing protein
MDKIIIQDLLVRGIIGVNEWERLNPQDILIHLEIFGDFRKAGETDDLADCQDYFALTEKVSKFAETIRRFTVEALATDIAKLCLSEPGVEKVLVRIEKPQAIPAAKSAGVEIVRTPQDFESNQ